MYKKSGLKKDLIRDYIDKYYINSNTLLLSLPNTNFQLEKKSKFSYCVERDKSIYKQQCSLKPKNTVIYNQELSSFLRSSTIEFDVAYLDFCSELSNSIKNCLNHVRIKKNGTLILTLMKKREKGGWNFLIKALGRVKAYEYVLKQFGFYLYYIINYTDTSSMVVLFAKRYKVSDTIKQVTL